MKSVQGTQFRIWATQRLKDYIIKGFALNDDRFKTGNSMNYFNELQDETIENYKNAFKAIFEKTNYLEHYNMMMQIEITDELIEQI